MNHQFYSEEEIEAFREQRCRAIEAAMEAAKHVPVHPRVVEMMRDRIRNREKGEERKLQSLIARYTRHVEHFGNSTFIGPVWRAMSPVQFTDQEWNLLMKLRYTGNNLVEEAGTEPDQSR